MWFYKLNVHTLWLRLLSIILNMKIQYKHKILLFYFVVSAFCAIFAKDKLHLGNKNKPACFILLSVCTIFA